MTDQETIAKLKQDLARGVYVVKEQVKEIDRLRAEIDRLTAWVNGDTDALTALQAIYNDTSTSEGNRIRAAASALPFERPKIVIQGYANVTSLAQRLDSVHPKVIEHRD